MLFRSNAFVCNSEGACEVPIVGPYMIATFVIIGFVILVFIIVISVVASKNKKNRQKRKNREAAKSERKIEMQPLRAAEQQAGTLEFFEALHIYCVLHSALIWHELYYQSTISFKFFGIVWLSVIIYQNEPRLITCADPAPRKSVDKPRAVTIEGDKENLITGTAFAKDKKEKSSSKSSSSVSSDSSSTSESPAPKPAVPAAVVTPVATDVKEHSASSSVSGRSRSSSASSSSSESAEKKETESSSGSSVTSSSN